jgi:hypothetical protein
MLCSNGSIRVAVDLALLVRIQTALHSGTGEVINLSQSGMYVSTAMCILPHAYVSVDLPCPETRKFLRIDGEMVWETRRQPHIPNGYGLRFTMVSKDAAWGIRRLMEDKGTKIPDRAGARNHMEQAEYKSPKIPERAGTRNYMEQAERLLEMILPSHGWHKVGL